MTTHLILVFWTLDKYRIFITIAVLCLYLALFNFYISIIPNQSYDYVGKKLLYYYITTGMLIFYYLNKYKSPELNQEFNKVCFFSVISNFIIIILNYKGLLRQPIPMFIAFNGLIFVITIGIGINLKKHGFLKG